MAYKWEKECLQKYGEEVTRRLITQQKEYEALKKDNDCEYCGKAMRGQLLNGVKVKLL